MTVSFSDIQAMLAARQPLPDPCGGACGLIFHQLQEAGMPLSTEWQYTVQRIAQFQNKAWPEIKHPRVAIYASNYGDDLVETQKRLAQLAQQQDPLTRLCGISNADLRVYELDLTQQIPPAGISEEEAAHALSYGLMAVEEHVDCLIVDCLSANSNAILKKWQDLLLQENETNALSLLQQAGAGHDVFALTGAVFAARMANIPVFGGAVLTAVMPLALSRILPNEQDVFMAMPNVFSATNIVQALAGLQQLQFILALGPVAEKPAARKNLINPVAAA